MTLHPSPSTDAYPVDWVDAFTDRAFGGNGCAVVHNAGKLSADTCITFTRETGLVECTFVEASQSADWRVRYFMPTGEIPFAGHPTVATVASLIHRGLVSGSTLTLETGAGAIEISVDHSGAAPWIAMTQVAPTFGAEVVPSEVAATVGLSADDILHPPQIVSTGLPFCITVLRSHDAMRRATADHSALRAFSETYAAPGVDVTFPYLVTLEGATERGQTYARLLLVPPFPTEDPFTGSATGAAAAYLWSRGLIDAPDYVAEQGHWMGRPGAARVRVLGAADAIQGVEVAGQAHILMSGDLHI